MDETTLRAMRSDNPAMVAAFRWEHGSGNLVVAKDIFVPLCICGRRWGNFELVYVDHGAPFDRG